MLALVRLIFSLIADLFRPRAALEAELLVLRQQIIVLGRGRSSRPTFRARRQIGGWLALPVVPKRPQRTDHCSAGDRRALASRRLPLVLALEIKPGRKPCPTQRDEALLDAVEGGRCGVGGHEQSPAAVTLPLAS